MCCWKSSTPRSVPISDRKTNLATFQKLQKARQMAPVGVEFRIHPLPLFLNVLLEKLNAKERADLRSENQLGDVSETSEGPPNGAGRSGIPNSSVAPVFECAAGKAQRQGACRSQIGKPTWRRFRNFRRPAKWRRSEWNSEFIRCPCF